MLLALGLYLMTVAPTLSWGWHNIGVDGGDQGGKVGVSLFEAFLQFFGGFF